jgi:YD repeat-containing protein
MPRSSWFATRSLPSVRLTGAAIAAGTLTGMLPAQVLEVHPPSLTTYLAARSTSQDVRPLVEQRATSLDGHARRESTHRLRLAANTLESLWNGTAELDDVTTQTGTWSPTEIDLALPALVPWPIGRTYNARQWDGSGYVDSNGAQGRNWFQTSLPEIVLYSDQGNTANDHVYVILGADRYAEFCRTSTNSNEFRAKNGASGLILYASGQTDTYQLLDQFGYTMYFFGFNAATTAARGQVWKIVAPDGTAAYVGDENDASNAVSLGYDTVANRMQYAYDSAARRYTYSFNSDTPAHISSIVAETKDPSSTWLNPTGVSEVARVEYYYYQNGSNGLSGDLKRVVTITPLSDVGSVTDRRVRSYRYWVTSTSIGFPHAIKYVMDEESARSFDWSDDATLNDSFEGASDTAIKPYASAYFQYDAERRVTNAWFDGKCGCTNGSGTGEFLLSYEENNDTSISWSAGYDSPWRSRTVIRHPDNTSAPSPTVSELWTTQYFDETGQSLSRVLTNGDPSGQYGGIWVDRVERDSHGEMIALATPENATSYTHNVGSTTSGAITASASAGLIRRFGRITSGDLRGFLAIEQLQIGTGGTLKYLAATSYSTFTREIAPSLGTVIRPFVSQQTQYEKDTSDPADPDKQTLTQTPTGPTGGLALGSMTLYYPTVSQSKHGSGTADIEKIHYADGEQPDFEVNARGTVLYREYENGLLKKAIRDADTTTLNPPTGFTHAGSGIPQHEVTEYEYDSCGRTTSIVSPSGDPQYERTTTYYYSHLKDGRLITLAFPRLESGTRFGPVKFSVLNHARHVEAEGILAVGASGTTLAQSAFIDETESDVVLAIDVGTITRLTVHVYDLSGTQRIQSRTYTAIPSTLPGAQGTHYDVEEFGYDGEGRRIRERQPSGTTRRLVLDSRGLVVQKWQGTNDHGFVGGSGAGTDDMTRIEELIYDDPDGNGVSNSGGNGYLNREIKFLDSSGSQKRESWKYTDARGRIIAAANAAPPHVVYSYDNLGRVVAYAQYSSSAGLGTSSLPGTSTNRESYAEIGYDERGRVYMTRTYGINTNGTSQSTYVQDDCWYDSENNLIKRDGQQLAKQFFDRRDRVSHQFLLAKDGGDTTYSDVDDVAGDVVLEEQQYIRDTSGNVILRATIHRLHNDLGSGQTLGALDSNADGDLLKYSLVAPSDIKGRIQITGLWYDELNRLTDAVEYGTYEQVSATNFVRAGLAVPSSADDKLRTQFAYGDSGELLEERDPKGNRTQYRYDAAGRRTATIRNYVDGSPTTPGSMSQEDCYTRYAYTNGLPTLVWMDYDNDAYLDTSGAEAEPRTRYTFGTTKGGGAGSSSVATGHLLRSIQYPDSSDSTADSLYDIQSFAYNAQGEVTWRRGQATNPSNPVDYDILEFVYDARGRRTEMRATATRAGTDTRVLRISHGYDALGRVSSATQYDASSGGNVVDQVEILYNSFGYITKLEQDWDSSIGSTGSQEIEYQYELSTSGRNAMRRSQMTLPGGTLINYFYRSAASSDSDIGRVTSVRDSLGTDLATYRYNGVMSVVGIELPEISIKSNKYGVSGSFPGLDRFDRSTLARWTKDLTPDRDIYRTTTTYDRNSIPATIDEAVQIGDSTGLYARDAVVTVDALNRLNQVQIGHLSSGTITVNTCDQEWSIDQKGDANQVRLNLTNDTDYTDANEYDDARTINLGSEVTGRDLDNNPSTTQDNRILTYDAAGSMLTNGAGLAFEWDAFGRLCRVKHTSGAAVEEYVYNGFDVRTGWRYDNVTPTGLGTEDRSFHFVHDERGRVVATFREGDDDPKEVFVHHAAGLGALQLAMPNSTVVCRERDASTSWTEPADGLDERVYYCQNNAGDVVALVSSSGYLLESVGYSPTGIPFGMPAGDANSDGSCTDDDILPIQGLIASSLYDVRADVDLNGVVDTVDLDYIQDNLLGVTLGWSVLSSPSVGNRLGYRGQEYDGVSGCRYHTRRGVLDSELGRWLNRRPVAPQDSPGGALARAASVWSDTCSQVDSLIEDAKCAATDLFEDAKASVQNYWEQAKVFVADHVDAASTCISNAWVDTLSTVSDACSVYLIDHKEEAFSFLDEWATDDHKVVMNIVWNWMDDTDNTAYDLTTYSDADALTQIYCNNNAWLDEVRAQVAVKTANGQLTGFAEYTYVQDPVGGMCEFAKDLTNIITLGHADTSNMALTFLGGHDLEWSAVPNGDSHEAIVTFAALNLTTISSGTRCPIPLVGYSQWYRSNVAEVLDSMYTSGNMSPALQIIIWTETIQMNYQGTQR